MTTKDRILKLLRENSDRYLSGQEIADTLFLTRAAVWKAVDSLRKSGIEIDAVTNKGYRMLATPGRLSLRDIIGTLDGSHEGVKFFYYDTLGSTNDTARDLKSVHKGAELVVVADTQTSGRGRKGRVFYSPEKTGLYMSFLVYPGIGIEYATMLTCVATESVAEAIEEVSGRSVSIKWLNDVYVGEKKIAGILTEAETSIEDGVVSSAVVGIGVNVYEPFGGFPEELKKKAGAVFTAETASEDDRNRLASAIIDRFFLNYRRWIGESLNPSSAPDGEKRTIEILERYRNHSNLIGSYVKIIRAQGLQGPSSYARVLGIDDRCRLEIEYDNGKKDSLVSGEVSVVKY